MNSTSSFVATAWRVARPYFSSEDKWAGRGLLAAVIGIELAIVGINVLLNQWNSRFYNALQERNWDSFVGELIYFCVVAAIYILLAVYQLYLNQWLQIRWRNWLTGHYLGEWLHDANHYRMQLAGDAADNPDQRMTDDVKAFVEYSMSLGVGLLSAIVTLISFVVILWGLSASAPLHLFGRDFDVPGYLVWGAMLYAVIGTAFTHLIGWPLAGLNFQLQAFEADFRFNLVRVRENAEQIALLKGEPVERDRLKARFDRVVGNWLAIMSRTKKVTAFTASYSQASVVFPFILVAPAYFADRIQLGGMMQTANAFSKVQESLSFFVSAYRQLAEWRAVIARLDGFEAAIAAGQALRTAPDTIHATAGGAAAEIVLRDLEVALPDGAPLLAAHDLHLRAGESVLITGPSGAGKSTLFRAVAGTWPFGGGTVTVPAGARVMVLPQRPYFPVGPLRAAIAYPATPEAFSTEQLEQGVADVGLPALAKRLDEDAHWNRMLSLGEQQRLGLLRALLEAPDFLFLDEATASLDEPAEAALYRLLQQRLPHTTVVSIGHRSTLTAFHRRSIALGQTASGFVLADPPAEAVPQA